MLKIGTFCSGIGSPEQALKNLNINHCIEFACEIDKYARQTYLSNHKVNNMYEDLTQIDYSALPDVNLFVAGFPCQSFSLAGKRLGFEDARGTIFFNILEYLKAKKPDVFILENVKGLLSHEQGKTFDFIINSLSKSVNGQSLMFPSADNLGYNVYYQVLNSKDYGIPQNRERIFIVGFKDDKLFSFPEKQELKIKLKDLLENNVDEKYYLSNKIIEGFLSKQSNFNARFKPKTKDSLIANTITARYFKQAITDNYIQLEKVVDGSQANRVYSVDGLSSCLSAVGGGGGGKTGLYAVPVSTPSRAVKKQNGRRFKNDNETMFTLTSQDTHGIYDGYRVRRLTPLECFRLMGFDDNFFTKSKYESLEISNDILKKYPNHKGKRIFTNQDRIEKMSDTQLYKQAGNSIVVNVIQEIMKKIYKEN